MLSDKVVLKIALRPSIKMMEEMNSDDQSRQTASSDTGTIAKELQEAATTNVTQG